MGQVNILDYYDWYSLNSFYKELFIVWETREQSIKALSKNLKEENEIIRSGFSLLKEIIILFEENKGDFNRICGLISAKGYNLCKGIFSLTLDGLGQEAGALLRPTIECFELLTYIHEDPSRIEEFKENKLPSAGKRAKCINGKFKGLREFLNKEASHISPSNNCLGHLLNFEDDKYEINQKFREGTFKHNFKALSGILAHLIVEAQICLDLSELHSKKLEYEISLWLNEVMSLK